MKKQIVEKKLGIPGNYQFTALRSKNYLQANWHHNKLVAIKSVIPLTRQSVILDLGPGSGNFELTYAKQVKQIISLDYNDESLAFLNSELKKNKIRNVQTVLLDIKDLKKLKPSAQIDTIIMIDVIEHLPLSVITSMIKEFGRLLKKGGRVCIVTPNYGSLWPLIEKTSDALHLLPQFDGEQHISKFDVRGLRHSFPAKTWDVEKLTTFNLASFIAPGKNLSAVLTKLELAIPLPVGNLLIGVFTKK